MYVNGKNLTYFDAFKVKHIRICGYFCIGFIDFLLKGKSLLHYTNLFCPNDYDKNYKTILKYF